MPMKDQRTFSPNGKSLAEKFHAISQKMTSFNSNLNGLQSPLIIGNQPLSPVANEISPSESAYEKQDYNIPAFFASHKGPVGSGIRTEDLKLPLDRLLTGEDEA